MASLDDILLLGDQRLYQKAAPVSRAEVSGLQPKIDLMAQLILLFRKKYGAGRAIAAPQIGLMKRIIVVNTDDYYEVLYNPQLSKTSDEMFELWDDCMSFPNLLVKVSRHQSCTVTFQNEDWEQKSWRLSGAMSELIQHEYDHLEGILAIQRALNMQSFKWKKVQ